ncbi:MAG: 2-hydroxymuconate tautomerase [Thermovirgaceae bacterium]
MPGPVERKVKMPILQIHLIEGRDMEKKKRLVKSLTQAVCESLDVKPEQVRIILSETSRENYAVAGKLFSEK